METRGPHWGMLSAVARKLKVTRGLVSRVNAGKATSQRVLNAIHKEQEEWRNQTGKEHK